MTDERSIIGLRHWLRTPAGRYLLQWEQAQLDAALVDLFGFHALQLGLPEIDALRGNRMPHRWVAVEEDTFRLPEPPSPPAMASEPVDAAAVGAAPAAQPVEPLAPAAVSVRCQFDSLPFPSQSLDLVVLPHTLELARDPHETLREVERVLMPEGRVVIVGYNPTSLWGLRQRLGRMVHGMRPDRPLFMPADGDFLGYWRLRDWLRLLSFDIERGRFGCYRPPVGAQRWLDRFAWMEPAGDRWWPVLGAVYLLVAVKRVRGMRLVGLAKRDRVKAQAAPAVVANRQRSAETPHARGRITETET